MARNGNAIHVAGTAPRGIARPAHADGVGRRGSCESKAEVNGIPRGGSTDTGGVRRPHMGNAVGTREK
jgi:hypothetical protein